ncbi:Family with sequence similarity 20, member [Nesidiocoris tenuis]|uniref:Family with sequence similarity 20, member n=1 Tax=Nesidiocoris tenuis TaxID=355587 RepID=A0ABN7B9R5_9HEMI|nr:Family with sequence similarity 20, member [Nesidiocoris tenuis]
MTIERAGIRYKFIFLCLILFAFANVFLIQVLLVYESRENVKSEGFQDEKSEPTLKPSSTTDFSYRRIQFVSNGVDSFFKQSIFSTKHEHNFSSLLTVSPVADEVNVWNLASKWVSSSQIWPKEAPQLSHVVAALKQKKIVAADVSTKGTQLKLALVLEGGQQVLFKPKWYDRDHVITGNVYGGKDRHNGEVAAFHLARLLGLNRVPIAAMRKINLNTEILPVASKILSRTFYRKDNTTCFYGVCTYCRPTDGVCDDRRSLEGAIVLWLPQAFQLVKHRHPWQRSYSSAPAKWQMHANYCSLVKRSKKYQDESKLLNLIETSIFDFLIDNGDRHHYERFASGGPVLLIDNGKSFGNPDADHLDILAPLIQCCRVPERIVSVLTQLQNGALSSWLVKLMTTVENDTSPPILNLKHLQALDRRLKLVLSAVLKTRL